MGKHSGRDKERIAKLADKKFELAVQLRDLNAEIGRINLELSKEGADAALIACW